MTENMTVQATQHMGCMELGVWVSHQSFEDAYQQLKERFQTHNVTKYLLSPTFKVILKYTTFYGFSISFKPQDQECVMKALNHIILELYPLPTDRNEAITLIIDGEKGELLLNNQVFYKGKRNVAQAVAVAFSTHYQLSIRECVAVPSQSRLVHTS